MEHRIVLTKEEANKLVAEMKFNFTCYARDEYTGTKRIRLDDKGITEKDYETPVSGIIHRFSSHCEMGNIQNIIFEYKWTDKTDRFEIEFEGEVPDEFKNRENIRGWDILR